ncbi:MAG: metallophosphoesterase family protein, partial [Myxococcota bacterium]|nr:metallophosphoesterase family protein [Myxococcota bacterium]
APTGRKWRGFGHHFLRSYVALLIRRGRVDGPARFGYLVPAMGGSAMTTRYLSSIVRATLPALLGVLATSGASAAPRWIRLSWTGPTDTTMTVSWTDDAAGGGQAEYRPVGGAAVSVAAAGTATGSRDLGATYVSELVGLDAGAQYEYRVQSGGRWSGWFAFRTAPPRGSCDPVRFVGVGDNRGQDLPLLGYVKSLQWDDIALAIAAQRTLFTLDTGDFVYDGAETGQWAQEFPQTEPLSRIAPFFLIQGNHDDGPGEGAGANYNKLFAYPADNPDGVEDYWAFVAGNVLVAGLSTYSFDMNRQIDWLRGVLEAHLGEVDWRVVIFHTPIWSSGAHGSNEDDRPRAARLVPLLDEFGVDLVLNGHDHNYERFHPSRGGYGGVPHVWTPLPHDGGTRGTAQGVTYIVTGGGGALANPFFSMSLPHSAAGANRLNFVVVDVAGGTMRLTAIDCGQQLTSLTGADCSNVIEVVTLEKETTVCGSGGDGDADADAGEDGDADEDADAVGPDDSDDVPPDVAADDGVDALDAGLDVRDATPGAGSGSGCGCRASDDGRLLWGPLLLLFPFVRRLRRDRGALRSPSTGR